MKKVLIALMMCAILVMQIPCVFAYEYTPYVGDGVIASTPVVIEDEREVAEGYEAVDNISDATRVVASCKVRTGSEYDGSEVDASLVVVGYKGKFLRDFAISSATFTSAEDGAKTLTTTLDIKDTEIDGIKVYIWDSVENAKPLLNKGVPGSDNNAVDGIIIGGEVVEIDANNTGAVEVNAGYVEWPEVIVLANDTTADVKVDLKGTFPLSKPVHTILEANTGVMGTSETGVVTITVGDEVYTIEVTQKVPQFTNVLFRKYKANMPTASEEFYTDKQLKIQYDIQNPVWTEEYPGPDMEDSTLKSQDYYKQINTLENVSWAYSDTLGANSQNAMFFDNIVPELLGAHFFAIPWVSTSNTATIDDCFKFTIERSGRVYMAYGDGSKLLDSSWKRAYTNMFASSDKSYGRMFYEMRINPTATTHTYQVAYGNQIYYKDFYVAPGETLEVSLPAGKNVPKVFFKYMDTEFVTGASYTTGGKKTDATLLYTAQPNYRDDNLLTDKYDLFVAPSSTTVPLFNGTGNILVATSTFTETDKKEFALMTVPDELVGATALRTPFAVSGDVKYEFGISQSARVYVFTNADNDDTETTSADVLASLGANWKNTTFEGNNPLAYRVDDNNLYEGITNNSSFYSDYIVQPDDNGKVTISLDGLKDNTRVIIIVKPLEE